MEFKSGLYVAVNFSDESLDKIEAMIEQLDLPNPVPRKDLHTTLLYSETPVSGFDAIPTAGVDLDKPFTMTPVEFEMFMGSDGNKCLVVIMSSPKLFILHHTIKNNTKSVTNHPTYKPHITLSYDCPDAERFLDKDPHSYLEFVDVNHIFANEREEDWAKSD